MSSSVYQTQLRDHGTLGDSLLQNYAVICGRDTEVIVRVVGSRDMVRGSSRNGRYFGRYAMVGVVKAR